MSIHQFRDGQEVSSKIGDLFISREGCKEKMLCGVLGDTRDDSEMCPHSALMLNLLFF